MSEPKTIRDMSAGKRSLFNQRLQELADAGESMRSAARVLNAEFPGYGINVFKVTSQAAGQEIHFHGTHRGGSRPSADEAVNTGEVQPAVLVERDQKIEALRAANRALELKYRAALQQRSALDCLRYTTEQESRLIRGSFDELGAVTVEQHLEHSHPQHAVLFLSCLHYGEVVSPQETMGIGAYSIPHAQAAYQVMVEGVVDLILNHHSGEDIEKLWVVDVGDNVSGNIHDELKTTNERPITSQVKGAALLKALAVRDLARHVREVEYVGLVGNHARTTQRPQYKEKSEDSFDRAVYEDLALLTSGIPNVTVQISPSPKKLLTIQGHNFLFEHGDTIPMWMQIPWYGAMREDARLTKLLTNFFDQSYKYFCFGNFHVTGWMQAPGGGKILMTGSPKGGDEYSIGRLGTASTPSQLFFGVHPKRGVSFTYDLNLSERDPEVHTQYRFDLTNLSLADAAGELGLL